MQQKKIGEYIIKEKQYTFNPRTYQNAYKKDVDNAA